MSFVTIVHATECIDSILFFDCVIHTLPLSHVRYSVSVVSCFGFQSVCYHTKGDNSEEATTANPQKKRRRIITKRFSRWLTSTGHANESTCKETYVHIDTHSITSSRARYQLLYYVLVFCYIEIFYSFWWQNFLLLKRTNQNQKCQVLKLFIFLCGSFSFFCHFVSATKVTTAM